MHRRSPRRLWERYPEVTASPSDFTLTGPITITVFTTAPPSSTQASSITSDTQSSPSPLPTSSLLDSIVPPPYSATPIESLTTPSASPSTVSISATALQSYRLSSSAIAGIVVVAALTFFGLVAFLVRQRYIRYRRRKTYTWGAGIGSKPISSSDMFTTIPLDIDDSREQKYGEFFRGIDSTSQPLEAITLPLTSYNNPAPSPMLPPSSPVSPAPTRLPAMPANVATVQRTFTPSLPDELSISIGEIVRVVGEYDDGWALCMNNKGDQGVVPLECLERGDSSFRNSRRASSLLPTGAGGRY